MKAFTILKIAVIGVFISSQAFADDAAILKRLNQLEQEVAILKRQLELSKEDADKKGKETAVVTANAKDGFSIKSPDDSFKLKLRGYAQADARYFANDQEVLNSPDTFLVRRARIIFEGNVGPQFGFYIMPELATTVSLLDAYGDWKFNDAAKVRFGKFKSPFSIERLQSIMASNFIELGLPTNLAPNRDTGVQLSGDILDQSLSYAFGVFNGAVDLGSIDADNNNDKDLVARVFAHPFKNSDIAPLNGLGVGIAASYGERQSTALPTYKSTGQANIFSYGSTVSADGDHFRLSPQFYYYNGPFSVLGEYIESEQNVSRTATPTLRDTFEHEAWQLSGTYVLTGELATHKGVTPRQSFNWAEKTWGAFEVAARYGQLDIDDDVFTNGFSSLTTSVSEANAWGLGLNWYLNKNAKFMINYEQTSFDGGAASGDREDEEVILSRFQIAY